MPLTQEGTEEIRKYELLIRDQAKKGVPIEVVELIHFMNQNKLNMASVFKST